MEEQKRFDDEMEIDLLEIVQLLWKKAWLIILCMIVGAGIAGVGTKFLLTPKYEASSMIYILGKTDTAVSTSDLQISKQITVDFSVLAKSRPVVNKVIEDAGLDMSYEEAVKMIKVESPQDSSILKMTAEHTDPEVARDMANALSDATAKQIEKVMLIDRPTTMEEAVTPEHPSGPNLMKNAILGALLGAVLICGYLVVKFLLDDTIKDRDDVNKYLGLGVFAEIPVVQERSSGKKSAKGSRARA